MALFKRVLVWRYGLQVGGWVLLFGGGCLLEHGRLFEEIQYLKICSTNGQHNSVCPYFFVVIVFPLTTFVDVEVDLKFPERRK